jgi:hypothetical protein
MRCNIVISPGNLRTTTNSSRIRLIVNFNLLSAEPSDIAIDLIGFPMLPELRLVGLAAVLIPAG